MYTLYFTKFVGTALDGEWRVYTEQYANIGDTDPIEGSTVLVSRNLTEYDADKIAASKQRASYSENRRQSNGA